jgi:hypothetical protein
MDREDVEDGLLEVEVPVPLEDPFCVALVAEAVEEVRIVDELCCVALVVGALVEELR